MKTSVPPIVDSELPTSGDMSTNFLPDFRTKLIGRYTILSWNVERFTGGEERLERVAALGIALSIKS